jgi:hypothetical protein
MAAGNGAALARGSSWSAGVELEITPEMVEAGRGLLKEVYRTM